MGSAQQQGLSQPKVTTKNVIDPIAFFIILDYTKIYDIKSGLFPQKR